MNPGFEAKLLCPNHGCTNSPLTLVASQTETINYRIGPMEEVRVGSLDCGQCGRSYPIEDYVLSFDQIFPPELKSEGEYWGK
ncbi:MAG TPA: hypothetical protein VLQ48_07770 [Chloroflexia bacterium]|nr:hypothetical protein [Chloroflexia bacterium]